jgi:hypothetical protein
MTFGGLKKRAILLGYFPDTRYSSGSCLSGLRLAEGESQAIFADSIGPLAQCAERNAI